MTRPRADSGAATVEFVYVAVLLLLPLVYFLLTVFDVQRSAFAAGDAAREAGRAFATARSASEGLERAQYAADLALANQGIHDQAAVRFATWGTRCGSSQSSTTPTLKPGAKYVVCVTREVYLPFADKGFFAHLVQARVPVTGQFSLVVDQWRAAR